MLIIGHRGASQLARENTIEALHAGQQAGADMLEFDVRLTRDKIPILSHDFIALRTNHDSSIISRLTLAELQERTHEYPFSLLTTILDEFFGKIILNIEVKGRGTGKIVAELLANNYIKTKKDWDNILISSFRGGELRAVRRISSEANLSLLHIENPFLFIAYHHKLHLTAVGFHRLYINSLALAIAKKANIFTYAYTVNRPATARILAERGLDGIITDTPDTVLKELKHSI